MNQSGHQIRILGLGMLNSLMSGMDYPDNADETQGMSKTFTA